MKELICPKCKAPMKKSERDLEPNLDTYVCVGCGTKKALPKKSEDKIAKEKTLEQLDRDRASSEGIMPDQDITPHPSKEASRIKDKDPSKIKTLTRENKILADEINSLRAQLEIKELQNKEIKKTAKSFIKGICHAISDLKSTQDSKMKFVETLLEDLEKQLKD